MVFQWSLSDSKFAQGIRTLLSILAGLNNAVIWMFFTCPLLSKSFSPFTNPLEIVPSAPITSGITVTSMFDSFFLDIIMIIIFFKVVVVAVEVIIVT